MGVNDWGRYGEGGDWNGGPPKEEEKKKGKGR